MTTALCQCGCGQPAPIFKYTNNKLGYVMGKPARFIRGHSGRKQIEPVEPKLCECGCGQFTSVAKSSNRTLGYIKGQPLRFCRGHYIKLHNITQRRQWPSVEERFWKSVDKTGNCWFWVGAKTGNGYGAISYKGRQIGTHCMSWMLANNQEIPKGMQVLHSCDNPLCVRPDHLSLGTLQENSKDMVRKGRASRKGPTKPARGEQSGSSVLTENKVREIRQLRSEGVSTKNLASQYSVNEASIRNIVRYKTWRHVE